MADTGRVNLELTRPHHLTGESWAAVESYRRRVVTLIVVAILVVIAYVGAHDYRYRNCVRQPSLSAWPRVRV
jgi:hypothetical protein